MKKSYISPLIRGPLRILDAGDDEEIGVGTGQSGDARPVSYADWLTLYQTDVNEDGVIDEDDWIAWMTSNRFNGWYDDDGVFHELP